MKKLLEISLLFFLSVTLCACPYSSAYYLDETPNIYVEDALVGKWIAFVKKPNSTREEAVYCNLEKKNDTEREQERESEPSVQVKKKERRQFWSSSY